jgi:hypothetical protein
MIWLTTPEREATPFTAGTKSVAVLVNEQYITSVWPFKGGSLVCVIGDTDGIEVIERPDDIDGIIGATL